MADRPEEAEDDLLLGAVRAALKHIVHLEKELVDGKLEENIYQYFWNAGEGLQAVLSWEDSVHQYADNVFGALMQTFSDRHWLNQVDFVYVVDAGIRMTFPPQTIVDVPEDEFQQVVLQAHDRAYEEHRFSLIVVDVVAEHVKEDALKKKVCEAFEGGRRDSVRELYAAFQSGDPQPISLEDFAKGWVRNTITWPSLATARADSALSALVVFRIFKTLVEVGTLPIPLVAKTGLPRRRWPLLETEVRNCCHEHGISDGGWGSTDGFNSGGKDADDEDRKEKRGDGERKGGKGRGDRDDDSREHGDRGDRGGKGGKRRRRWNDHRHDERYDGRHDERQDDNKK